VTKYAAPATEIHIARHLAPHEGNDYGCPELGML